MRTFWMALAFAGALSACANGYGMGGYGGGEVAYYDDYYGPFTDGYWGANDVFFFRDRDGFRADDGHHFRREAMNGFHSVRGHMRAPAQTAPMPNQPR